MLYGEQLIYHAADVALTCNEDVRTAFACVSFPELGAERYAIEAAARPKEDLLTRATLNVLGVALPRGAVNVEFMSLIGDVSMS
eukprot:6954764-Lingulodinium_polyedra.AAC.1